MAVQNQENQITKTQKYFICNQCCFWIFQLIVIVLCCLVMGLVIRGYQASQEVITSNEYQHSLQTIWLWKQGYIIDIKAEKTNNCPQGYEPLITHQWPGTVDGCSCSSTSNGYTFQFVLEGRCNSQLIALGCSTVNAVAAQTLNMWKGNSLLCYKRASSMTFYESVVNEAPAGGTSANMTTCAASNAYQVTTLPGVPCPVSAFSNNSVGGSQTTLSLDATNNYNLNFINQTGYPIAAFKLTEYQFCEFFNVTNISPNKGGTYVLLNSNLNNPCTTTDSRMNQIDAMDQLNLYQNNSRIYTFIQGLPAYPQPSVDYVFKLGYISYPTWTFACRSHADYNLYKATDKLQFKKPKQAMDVSVGVVVTCALILIFLMRLFYIIRHIVDLKSRSSYNALMLTDDEIAEQIPNLDILRSYKRQTCLFVIELVLIMAMAGSIIYALVMMTFESVWIKDIIKNQCTDAYLQNIFLFYQHRVDYISEVLIKASFLWAVLIICYVAYFVTRNKIGDLSSNIVEPQSVKEESMNSENLKIMEKENKLEGVYQADSSEVILNKDENSELKVYDLQFLVGDNGGETKYNFFGSGEKEANVISKKKKKKKKTSITKKKKEKQVVPDFDDDFNL